ncbi:M48 family metallopeptidase [Actinokineospora soli]|uniref:M48 family metallopeptidase n=1 Tax=Actinokineospora soli TaxID=1048753 RepID=A0ABW2TVL1_9PSEU
MSRLSALARRLDARQFAAYAAVPPSRAGWTGARVALVAVSVAITVVVLGLLALGVWLVVDGFPSWRLVPGLVLIGIAWTLRPRLGSAGERWAVVTEDDAPTLFALLARVATATGAPMPHVVALDYRFNASAGVHGLRRTRTLVLGLPLWGSLEPDQRVALLGHEFGHFVNNDPTRSILTQPALTTPGVLAQLLWPSRSLTNGNLLIAFAEWVLAPVQRLVARGFLLLQAGLLAVATRDHQRAEYCADALSARVAGSGAAVALLDGIAAASAVETAVVSAERKTQATATPRSAHPGPGPWREAARAARAGVDLAAVRDQTVAESTLWDSHPPTGLRARLVEAWPHQDAAVVLGRDESDRVDAELAKWYAKAGRDLVWE